MKKYKPRKNGHLTDESAERFVEFLEQEFPSGYITPDEVIRKASKKSSAVHDMFVWDDSKAAHEYRLWQARAYIGSIVIETSRGDDVRAFHNVRISVNERAYVSLEEARDTPDLWQQVIDKAIREAELWSERYKMYQQLTPIRRAISKVKEKFEHEKAQARN